MNTEFLNQPAIPNHVQELDTRARRIAKTYLCAESEIITVLQDFDRCRGYLHFGVTSLIGYTIEILKLSEGAASNLVTVARKSLEFPALKSAIEAGEVTVSKARKIASVLTKENQNLWIDLAKTSTSRVIEREVARANPQAAVPEKLKYKTAERLELSFGISEKLSEKLKKVKDLLAQKRAKVVCTEEALEALVDDYLERHDPIKKAERAKMKIDKREVLAHGNVQRVPGRVDKVRPSLPAAIKHAVTLRDLRQCTHIDGDGRRCSSSRWLDVHHIIPVARGGTNELKNLTTLCSAHHKLEHLNLVKKSLPSFEFRDD